MENIDNVKKDAQEFLDGFKTMVNDLKTKGRRHKQIPNLLTLSRLGIACFIPMTALSGNLVLASLLAILAASTDGFDGIAARKLNAISEFGKNLDPVCDKLFAMILIIPLMLKLSPIVILSLGVNLVLEGVIAGINLKSKVKGNIPRTSIIGKIKTALLSLLLASLYISFTHSFNPLFIPIIHTLVTTTQVLACINYHQIDKKKDILKESNKENKINTKKNEKIIDNEKVKEKEEYTIEDYKRLREEIIKTNETQVLTLENGFQKIKK